MGKIFASVTPSEKFAWPGGYPLYYLITYARGEAHPRQEILCPVCATGARALSIRNEGPRIEKVQCDANYEDPDLLCDGCSERIESAYVEDHATGEHDKTPDETCFLCKEEGKLGPLATESGYTPCACRDCFEIAISTRGEPLAMCNECADAGCERGEHECCREIDLEESDEEEAT